MNKKPTSGFNWSSRHHVTLFGPSSQSNWTVCTDELYLIIFHCSLSNISNYPLTRSGCKPEMLSSDLDRPSLVQSTSLLFSCGLRSRYCTNIPIRRSPSEPRNMLISENLTLTTWSEPLWRSPWVKNISQFPHLSVSLCVSSCRLWTTKRAKMSE